MCRGCCCGSSKVAGIDHDAQLRNLRAALSGSTTRLRVTGCLPARAPTPTSSSSNPPRAGAPKAAARPGSATVNDHHATADIAAFTHAGGPGITELPEILQLYVFTPPRPRRKDR
ncbi:hypothetical protein ACU686_38505 [Yinghuangia aomiensis]